MSITSAQSRLRLIPIALAQGVGLMCGLIGVKLNSHLIPPGELGRYGLFLTFAPLGMWVVHAGLIKFTGRHWAGSADRVGLWREIMIAWRRRLVWLALASVGAACTIGNGTPVQDVALGVALFFAASLLALATLMQATLQAERAHWRDCAVASVGSIGRSFLPPLLFVGISGTLSMLWLGFCLHALLIAGVAAWMISPYWKGSMGKTNPTTQLTRVYDGTLFVSLALASWTLTGLNRWLVAWQFGETEAGYFTLAGGAALMAPSVFGSVILQYAQPGFFALGDAGPSQLHRLADRVDVMASAYTVLALLATVAVSLLAPWLIGPLIAPRYQDALPWLLPAGCFATATMTAVFFHTLLLAGHRERACAPVDLLTAGVLAAGCLLASFGGVTWLQRWLLMTPAVPWLLTRPLARHYLFKPVAGPTPGSGP